MPAELIAAGGGCRGFAADDANREQDPPALIGAEGPSKANQSKVATGFWFGFAEKPESQDAARNASGSAADSAR